MLKIRIQTIQIILYYIIYLKRGDSVPLMVQNFRPSVNDKYPYAFQFSFTLQVCVFFIISDVNHETDFTKGLQGRGFLGSDES